MCETFWSERKLLQHKWTFCGCHANRRTRRLCHRYSTQRELESKSNSLMENNVVQSFTIFAEPHFLITPTHSFCNHTCVPLLLTEYYVWQRVILASRSPTFLLILCPITMPLITAVTRAVQQRGNKAEPTRLGLHMIHHIAVVRMTQ